MNPNPDTIQQFVRSATETIQSKFETAIVSQLAEKGYSFVSHDEMMEFIKNRCETVTEPNQTHTLFVDHSVRICSWREDMDFVSNEYDSKVKVNLSIVFNP